MMIMKLTQKFLQISLQKSCIFCEKTFNSEQGTITHKHQIHLNLYFNIEESKNSDEQDAKTKAGVNT